MWPNVVRAVIMGAPASGKGTISKKLVEKFGFVHISAGDLLRLNVKEGTELGKQAKNYMDRGELVPDEIITKTILKKVADLGCQSWLLDGFPRSRYQAEELKKLQNLDTVITLNVPHDVIIERVKHRLIHLPSGRVYNKGFNEPKVPGKDDVTGEDLVQRDDDKPEVLRRRLEEYDEKILKPVLDFYNQDKCVTVFHGKTTSEIWPQIEKFVEKLFLKSTSKL